jgi:hypothetical protein
MAWMQRFKAEKMSSAKHVYTNRFMRYTGSHVIDKFTKNGSGSGAATTDSVAREPDDR